MEPNKDFNRTLWILLEKVPTPVDNELAVGFDRFEVLVNKLRNDLPTYQKSNLRPLLRKAMSALCTLSCAICHPTDKGLGLYVPRTTQDCHLPRQRPN